MNNGESNYLGWKKRLPSALREDFASAEDWLFQSKKASDEIPYLTLNDLLCDKEWTLPVTDEPHYKYSWEQLKGWTLPDTDEILHKFNWESILSTSRNDNRSTESEPVSESEKLDMIQRQVSSLLMSVDVLKGDHHIILDNDNTILQQNEDLKAQVATLTDSNVKLETSCSKLANELEGLNHEASIMRTLLCKKYPAQRIFFISNTLGIAFLFSIISSFFGGIVLVHPAIASLGLIGSFGFAIMTGWRIKHNV